MPLNRPEHTLALDAAQRSRLLHLARESIKHGLTHGRAMAVKLSDYPAQLQAPGACFVTLHRHGQLRGCIGSLEARRPLVEDIAENAYAAACLDPRFSALRRDELDALEMHISILQPAQPLSFTSEAQLLAQLRPGIDGLILQDGAHRATFLPAVWEGLPEPRDFLQQLKRKAGLPADHWSHSLQAWRYTTESFP